MIKVSDKITLMMLLDNDKEWPIERFVFKSLQISESVLMHVPQAHFQFADRESVLQKFPVGDGQTIRIMLKIDGTNIPAYDIKMRVFKLAKTTSANIDYYNLYLIYDAPRFVYENHTGSITGSSAEALKQIAEKCGLTPVFNFGSYKYDGNSYIRTNTPDSQTWIPRGDKYCSYARKIVAAGYTGDTSCMQMAVDLKGNLIYRNLSQPWYGEKGSSYRPYTFSTVESSQAIPILSKKEFTKTGVMNAFGGYRMTTVEQNPTKGKSTSQDKHSKVSTVTKTDSVAVNKNINEGISGSRVDFAPINCGNNHANYDKALHQNSRLLGLYAVGLYIVTDKVNADVTLLQTIKLDSPEISNNERQYNKTVAGEWEVSAKTIFINTDGKYYEKYEVLRQGVNNTSGNTTQSGTAS